MPTPFAIFCADPLDPRAVEPAFADEAQAARDAGFSVVRIDHDELDHRIDPIAALRQSRFDGAGTAVYRGWMMSIEAYQALYEALRARSILLATSPREYAACHHAPGSYPALAEWMPKTVWIKQDRIESGEAIGAAVEPFGHSSLILKDWVKSQASGYWEEACFIADAADSGSVHRTIARFRELQGDSLVGGLVFKQYIPLLPVGAPAHEYRAFIVDGRLVGCWPRSEAANVLGPPPAGWLGRIAAQVPSSFASADFGRDEVGRWWLLEVGTGQVSGLPVATAAVPLFQALASRSMENLPQA